MIIRPGRLEQRLERVEARHREIAAVLTDTQEQLGEVSRRVDAIVDSFEPDDNLPLLRGRVRRLRRNDA